MQREEPEPPCPGLHNNLTFSGNANATDKLLLKAAEFEVDMLLNWQGVIRPAPDATKIAIARLRIEASVSKSQVARDLNERSLDQVKRSRLQ